MFACASAVVLQVGGVLQHGALCAREYAKPAVSSIDIHALLKDGMMVSVDGNTGIVKILDQPN
jgi:pyruvate,water dikinase